MEGIKFRGRAELDERIAAVSAEIQALAQQDDSSQRLMGVPGIGPISATC
jgi:transposase